MTWQPIDSAQEDIDSLENDLEGLALGIKAMEITSPRMRESTLRYLWDRYVTHADPPEAQ